MITGQNCILRAEQDGKFLSVVENLEYHYQHSMHLTDVLLYAHDDLTIPDASECQQRVFEEFVTSDRLAVVGLGGATSIGTPDIYKKPYHITQLIRGDYKSNQTDWQVHGGHENGVRNVAVVDGFYMAVSRKFLKLIGGFSWMQTNFHCYDTALCLEAIRRGWEVRTVGVSCTHHGGGTSTKQPYLDWCVKHGTTPEKEHAEPHKWLYNRYRDLLPLKVD